jgi:hypothetical protein
MKKVGYHGTTTKNVLKIIKDGFKISDENNWLGKGVYFWGFVRGFFDGRAEADLWVRRHLKTDKVGVIKCLIQSNDEMVLDIAKNFDLYEKIKNKLLELHLSLNKKEEDFDSALIFQIIDVHYKLNVVIALTEGSRSGRLAKYEKRIVQRPQIQICVKNTSCIKNKTILR